MLDPLEPRLLLDAVAGTPPDSTPAWVSEVLVSGTTWSSQFLAQLAQEGLGLGGYRVDGSASVP